MKYISTIVFLILTMSCATLPYDNSYVKETQISQDQFKIVCTTESNCLDRASELCHNYKVDSLNESTKNDVDLACSLLHLASKDEDDSDCEPEYTEHRLIVTCP